METKFQTSFIPKKPLISQEHVHTTSGTSIFMVIASVLFIASLAGAVFTFMAKAILLKSQVQAQKDLKDNEQRFNLSLIDNLKKANIKIDLANQLLKNHIAVSEVFNIIAGLTIDGVRFSNLEFSVPSSGQSSAPSSIPNSVQSTASSQTNNQATYKITMKGIATSFNSVAWQSDVFSRSSKYGTDKALKNPILSNLTVDINGNVLFDFSANIALSDISYANVLSATLKSENSVPNSDDTTTQKP